jgi:phenylacetate-coenzyme A ligase PaaK-like adenylate-forming protein
MLFQDELKSAVLQVDSVNFEALALEIFRFQASQNPVYQSYLRFRKTDVKAINRLEEIPFLPISLFKTHQIITDNAPTQRVFESSGTTGQQTSRHFIADLAFYEAISEQIFKQQYGTLSDFHILALLPSYLERNNSSLVYMVQHFMSKSASSMNGFYLDNLNLLYENLRDLLAKDDKKPILLIGVSFALLDFVEQFQLKNLDISRLIVMETGGMKGRRREMIREEVHDILTTGFSVKKIHSEYGMTELLSQGYSQGDGVFELPPSMQLLFREVSDPMAVSRVNQRSSNGLNVIDLANIDSCCFIETQDLGSIKNNQLSILGRFDNSDVRGCNLMVQ